MKRILATVVLLALCSAASALAETSVPVRHSKPFNAGRGDGTIGYRLLEDEAPYFAKITEKRIDLWAHIRMPKPLNMSDAEWEQMQAESREKKKALIPAEDYELVKQVDEYVGWFGIVRGNVFDESRGETRLRVEHKYFDGLTDLRLHIVSIYGAGDFDAVIPGKLSAAEIPLLSLVCVYGVVSRSEGGRVELKPDYVRVWDWGLFAFMDYGTDKSRSEWVKLRSVSGPLVYSSAVDRTYYEERLGKR